MERFRRKKTYSLLIPEENCISRRDCSFILSTDLLLYLYLYYLCFIFI
jgi:hypothetical protein